MNSNLITQYMLTEVRGVEVGGLDCRQTKVTGAVGSAGDRRRPYKQTGGHFKTKKNIIVFLNLI